MARREKFGRRRGKGKRTRHLGMPERAAIGAIARVIRRDSDAAIEATMGPPFRVGSAAGRAPRTSRLRPTHPARALAIRARYACG